MTCNYFELTEQSRFNETCNAPTTGKLILAPVVRKSDAACKSSSKVKPQFVLIESDLVNGNVL